MSRTLCRWLIVAVVVILAGNAVALAGIVLENITQLHPTIIVALMVLFGAAISAAGFLVDWVRH